MPSRAPIRQVTTPAGDPAWLVSSYDDVKKLLNDPRLGRSHPDPDRAARYSDAAILGRPVGSPATEQADHARMRALLTRSFSARRMENIRPRVQELVDGLLDGLLRQAPPVDFHAAVSFPLPALVICQLLGVPYEDSHEFRRWSDDAADMTDAGRSRAGWAQLFGYMLRLAIANASSPPRTSSQTWSRPRRRMQRSPMTGSPSWQPGSCSLGTRRPWPLSIEASCCC
jgi:cytochrome P450